MEKPITIRKTEFVQKLAQAINESKLPAFVVADCLALTKIEIDKLANQQLQVDMEQWKAYYEKQQQVEEPESPLVE